MEETRIFDLLTRFAISFAEKKDVFAAKINDEWNKYSTIDYIYFANLISIGLLLMGFKKGDKIATISNNRPEWNFFDIGMMQIGVVHVPIYPNIGSDEYAHILNHSNARLLLVSDLDLYNQIQPIAVKISSIENIYTFNKINGLLHWTELIELAKSVDYKEYCFIIDNIKSAISKDDLATIIYTSGTTGLPKGVMLSHWNFMYQVHEMKKFIPIDHRHRVLSFLPLCHVLERIGGYTFQYMGISIYYAESIEKIADNVREIKPHGFITVPRLLEKVYDKIITKGKELGILKRVLFFWAVNLGHLYDETGNNLYFRTRLKIADYLIFRKWREALGGNMQMIISGGAALQSRLARIFCAAGMTVQEGYGLTETAPVICVNRDKYPGLRIGTVGPKIGKEQEIRIAGDGEILFKGPNLMLGYYKDVEMTKEVVDADGWFHTGDIGEMVENEYLRITDRKKEIFKLSTGKYVAPQPIENLFKESLFIEQIMIVGENQKYTGALISPNFEFLHQWCFIKKIQYRDNTDLVEIPLVKERYQKEIERYNQKLGKTKQVKSFSLVCEEWTTQTGELSPTLKLHRKFIAQKFKHNLNQIYKKE